MMMMVVVVIVVMIIGPNAIVPYVQRTRVRVTKRLRSQKLSLSNNRIYLYKCDTWVLSSLSLQSYLGGNGKECGRRDFEQLLENREQSNDDDDQQQQQQQVFVVREQ